MPVLHDHPSLTLSPGPTNRSGWSASMTWTSSPRHPRWGPGAGPRHRSCWKEPCWLALALFSNLRCGLLPALWKERLSTDLHCPCFPPPLQVVFKAVTTGGQEIIVDCPSKLPEANKLDSISEPYVR